MKKEGDGRRGAFVVLNAENISRSEGPKSNRALVRAPKPQLQEHRSVVGLQRLRGIASMSTVRRPSFFIMVSVLVMSFILERAFKAVLSNIGLCVIHQLSNSVGVVVLAIGRTFARDRKILSKCTWSSARSRPLV